MKALLTALEEGRLIELPGTDKEKSLTLLAHLIEAAPDINVFSDLAESVLARERSANTAIGLGVACPHARVDSVSDLVCAVGWSPEGIHYGAPDGGKVHLVVLYVIPDSQKGTYLKEVSALAQALQSSGGIQPIAAAGHVSEVREQLLNWVTRALEASAPASKAKMIQLQARLAAVAAEIAPVLPAGTAVQVETVLFLHLGEGKILVLSRNPEFEARMERDPRLPARLRERVQFDCDGYRILFRDVTAYGGGRVLYECLAVRVAGEKTPQAEGSARA